MSTSARTTIRWIVLGLLVLIAALQLTLWTGPGGMPDAWRLRERVVDQAEENRQLLRRNQDLGADVQDLSIERVGWLATWFPLRVDQFALGMALAVTSAWVQHRRPQLPAWLRGTSGVVAFWAHIGGFVAGVAMAIPLRYRRSRDTPAAPGHAGEPAPVATPDPGLPPPPPHALH